MNEVHNKFVVEIAKQLYSIWHNKPRILVSLIDIENREHQDSQRGEVTVQGP